MALSLEEEEDLKVADHLGEQLLYIAKLGF